MRSVVTLDPGGHLALVTQDRKISKVGSSAAVTGRLDVVPLQRGEVMVRRDNLVFISPKMKYMLVPY